MSCALLGGTRHVRKIAAPALAQHSKGEIQPGPDLMMTLRPTCWPMPAAPGTALYHPVGTCKMGEDPRARGRLAAARARHRAPAGDRRLGMPTLTTGNTNAPRS